MLLLAQSPLLQPTTILPSDFSQAALPTTNPPFEASSSLLLLSTTTNVPLLDIFLNPVAALVPLNSASEAWVRTLVWTDFRVAVSFFVVCPLLLLGWAIALRVPKVDTTRSNPAETVLRLMTSYWQASSLLLLTVLLNISESNLGVLTGLLAQAMIVVSLLWWEDLENEIDESKEWIGKVYKAWRSIAIVSATAGVIIQAPFQTCLGVSSLRGDAFCAPWLEPPKFAAGLVGINHFDLMPLANSGCTLYALVLLYYGLVLLPTVGRSGRAQRPKLMDVATPIGAWIALGFLDPQEEESDDV